MFPVTSVATIRSIDCVRVCARVMHVSVSESVFRFDKASSSNRIISVAPFLETVSYPLSREGLCRCWRAGKGPSHASFLSSPRFIHSILTFLSL